MSKTDLFLLRRKKKIRLREIAEYIGCSISFISYYENDKKHFDDEKEGKYKDFILDYSHPNTKSHRKVVTTAFLWDFLFHLKDEKRIHFC